MKQKETHIGQLVKNLLHKLNSIKRIGCAVIKTAKKPRKILRAMLCRFKIFKSKGKIYTIKKVKPRSFSFFGTHRYLSSAVYRITGEVYFLLI